MNEERRNAPTSLTLHDQFCAARSFGLATNCQVYTFPWGNPGEMQPGPESPIHTGLERPPNERYRTSFIQWSELGFASSK
jgi:hypothetical protein